MNSEPQFSGRPTPHSDTGVAPDSTASTLSRNSALVLAAVLAACTPADDNSGDAFTPPPLTNASMTGEGSVPGPDLHTSPPAIIEDDPDCPNTKSPWETRYPGQKVLSWGRTWRTPVDAKLDWIVGGVVGGECKVFAGVVGPDVPEGDWIYFNGEPYLDLDSDDPRTSLVTPEGCHLKAMALGSLENGMPSLQGWHTPHPDEPEACQYGEYEGDSTRLMHVALPFPG